MSTLPKLRVWDEAGHPCRGRYLVTERGEPFFYLGDTAWELFHRLTREEADLYLKDRAAKGFTVIQPARRGADALREATDAAPRHAVARP